MEASLALTCNQDLKKMKEKILVALSGGVDSAAAALLLSDAGHELAGVTMKLYSTDEELSDGKVENPTRDIMDAKSICDALGIEHHSIKLGETEVQNGGEILACSGGTPTAETELAFSITEDPKRSGNYMDTLTFTVSIDEN